jgi:hypothetical protein
VDEHQLASPQPDDIARLEQVVPAHDARSDGRAVAAAQVAQPPVTFLEADLRVLSAAPLVGERDVTRRRAAQHKRLAGRQPAHVRIGRAFANNEIGQHAD